MRREFIGIVLVSLILTAVAGPARATLSEGFRITNMVYGKFILGGNATEWISKAGYDQYNYPNSFTAFVLVTDTPQLCLKVWKTADFAKVESGSQVCFTMSFSNCGGYSGENITMIDAIPANVLMANPPNNQQWVGGGGGLMTNPVWTYDPNLPSDQWFIDSYIGQVGPLYIKFRISKLGIQQSGWQRYCVTIL